MQIEETEETAQVGSRKTVELAEGIHLPLQEIVTGRMAVVGVSGSGKTHTVSVIAEDVLGAGARMVILDPLGVWWGLRATAGDPEKTGALPIYILGGDHGDLPLDPTGGAAVADLVADEKLSVILDLSHIEDERDQAVFARDFARRLRTRNQGPLLIAIDEADIFVPEQTASTEAYECRSVYDWLTRRGRVKGFGVALISQRPAVIQKNLLTQIGTLIVHRLAGPPDVKAIDDWFRRQATDAERKDVLSSLSTLPKGDAWLWSPVELGILQRIHIRDRHTYNSSATPEIGALLAEPTILAPPDLSLLAERLAASIQRVQESDPDYLKKRVAELEGKLRDAHSGSAPANSSNAPNLSAAPVAEPKIVYKDRIVEVPVDKIVEVEKIKIVREPFAVISPEDVQMIQDFGNALQARSHELLAHGHEVIAMGKEMHNTSAEIKARLAQLPEIAEASEAKTEALPAATASSVPAPSDVRKPSEEPLPAFSGLPSGAKRLLRVLMIFNGSPVIMSHLSALSGLSNLILGGSARNLSLLVSSGLIECAQGEGETEYRATPEGIALMGVTASPSAAEVRQEIVSLWESGVLGEGTVAAKILNLIATTDRPSGWTLPDMAGTLGMKSSSAEFTAALARLQSLGLVKKDGGRYRADASISFTQA